MLTMLTLMHMRFRTLGKTAVGLLSLVAEEMARARVRSQLMVKLGV